MLIQSQLQELEDASYIEFRENEREREREREREEQQEISRSLLVVSTFSVVFILGYQSIPP